MGSSIPGDTSQYSPKLQVRNFVVQGSSSEEDEDDAPLDLTEAPTTNYQYCSNQQTKKTKPLVECFGNTFMRTSQSQPGSCASTEHIHKLTRPRNPSPPNNPTGKSSSSPSSSPPISRPKIKNMKKTQDNMVPERRVPRN